MTFSRAVALAATVLFSLWSTLGVAHAQRPWRLTLGYDSSQLHDGGGGTPERKATDSERGAFTVGASFDVTRFSHGSLSLFVYGDYNRLYTAGGVGARQEFGNVLGGRAYVGAGVGIYGLELGNGAMLGSKAFLGLQLPAAWFVELGVPSIANSNFRSSLAVGAGVRF